MAQNVTNGVICSTAKVEKETEKALCLTYSVDIYGEWFVIKKQWFPKSQLEIHKQDGDTIWFKPTNDWILDKKTKEYCKFVVDMFPNVKHEIKTYLSNINNVVINQVSR